MERSDYALVLHICHFFFLRRSFPFFSSFSYRISLSDSSPNFSLLELFFLPLKNKRKSRHCCPWPWSCSGCGWCRRGRGGDVTAMLPGAQRITCNAGDVIILVPRSCSQQWPQHPRQHYEQRCTSASCLAPRVKRCTARTTSTHGKRWSGHSTSQHASRRVGIQGKNRLCTLAFPMLTLKRSRLPDTICSTGHDSRSCRFEPARAWILGNQHPS